MTVLQLGPYPPPHGGVQTNIVAIRALLRRQGIAAPVINLTRHRRNDADDVYYPDGPLRVVSLLATLPADVIHLHIGGRLTLRLLALCLLCSLMPGRRVVLTFHSGGYPTWQAGRNVHPFSLRGFILRRLEAIIAVNAEIATLFRRLGVSPSRIRVMCPYAPVSVRDDVALPEPMRTFCSAHSPLLTTVGLLEPEYDLPLQVAALATLRRKYTEAGLVVIGSGSLATELQRLLASEPHGRHVLLCGDVPHPLTVCAIAKSDVFLRTTLYDGDSVSVREALQLGVPVIATDNGMRPPGAHLIARPDVDALCKAVEEVLREPRPAARRGSSKDELDEVLDLYSGLLGREIRPNPQLTVP
jgi:glycosyltransferase involved in cell wall biosynthesis